MLGKNLESYAELTAIEFLSEEHLSQAIELLWNPLSVLSNIPYAIWGVNKIIVPEEMVKYFHCLKFSVERVEFEDYRYYK